MKTLKMKPSQVPFFFLDVFRGGFLFDEFLSFGPAELPVDPLLLSLFCTLYSEYALTLMISWLSCSSPVSDEKPRYTLDGTLMGVSPVGLTEKQDVHLSSDLYCRSSERDLSWK